GGQPGGAAVDLPRGERHRDRLGRLEPHQLGLDPRLPEEPLLDADEDRRRGAELEDADPHPGGLGRRRPPAGGEQAEGRRERQQQQPDEPPASRHGPGARSTPGKKYGISKAAEAGESEPWTAFASIDSAKSRRI